MKPMTITYLGVFILPTSKAFIFYLFLVSIFLVTGSTLSSAQSENSITITNDNSPITQLATALSRCESLNQTIWPGLEITSTQVMPATSVSTNIAQDPLPSYCRVEAMIDRRTDADGREFGIGLTLAPPSNWNGRFLYQGGGGFNGVLREPLGPLPNGDSALSLGFAVVSTDGGHKGGFVEFLTDQQAALDYAYNAVPTVTLLGKILATHYYGRSPHHTYSVGCSTGGREGMLASQLNPLLFDDVIAGAPASRVWYSQISAWNNIVAFNRIAPTSAVGAPLPLEAFPPADQRLLHSTVAQQCDALDGLTDGFIHNIAACQFDPSVLQCSGEKAASCLSANQVTALHTAFDELHDIEGTKVINGFPYDLNLLGEHVGHPMSVLPSRYPGQFGPSPSPLNIDMDNEIARVREHPVAMLADASRWTDLDTFHRNGGKIMFYHGASDPWFSINDTIDYYERLTEDNPEADFSRFYAIPGTSHCGIGGTDVFDLLTPLIDWVENNVTPQEVIATSRVDTELSRPLCPWPEYAHYSGNRDPNQAENFECRVPNSL